VFFLEVRKTVVIVGERNPAQAGLERRVKEL